MFNAVYSMLNQRLKQWGLIAFVLIASFSLSLFQNCSKAQFVKVGDDGSLDSSSRLGDGNGLPSPDDVHQAISDCQVAAAKGSLRTLSSTVNFADPADKVSRTEVCDWQRDGNLSEKNGFVRARYEQYRKLALPRGAKLCNVSFNIKDQKLKYDDHFFLTLNGVVLASDAGWAVGEFPALASAAGKGTDLYVYDWDSIKGMAFPANTNDRSFNADYCLGKNCQWPHTEYVGPISMAVSKNQMTELGLFGDESEHEFGFTVLGDDDRSDCRHSEIQLGVDVEYFTPK